MQQFLENLKSASSWTRDLFFSFEGRASRSQYWIGNLILFLSAPLLFSVIVHSHSWIGDFNSVLFLLLAVAFIFFGTWTSLALAVKRLHDRDKNAYWLLLFYGFPVACEWKAGALTGIGHIDDKIHIGARFTLLVPSTHSTVTENVLIVLPIVAFTWAFVELALRKGIEGGNLYGEGPLRA